MLYSLGFLENNMELKQIKIRKMNKFGWTMRDFLPALIIFGLVVSVFYIMIQNEANNYVGVGGNLDVVDTKILSHYGNLTQNINYITQMKNQTNSPNGYTLIGGLGNMFQAVLGVVKLLFDVIGGISSQMYYLPSDFGWAISPALAWLVIGGIGAILTVIIVLLILNGTKWGNRI